MDENFGEKVSFRLSRMNVFLTVGITFFILVFGTAFLISFSPLRQFIPGYTNRQISKLSYENQLKLDSLSNQIQAQNLMMEYMKIAISGDIPVEKVSIAKDSMKTYTNIPYSRSKQDSLLRLEIENAEKYNLALRASSNEIETSRKSATDLSTKSIGNYMFFVPLQGVFLNEFHPATRHFGVDIMGKNNDLVKAVLDGTVISADWTPNAGYVIAIQHNNNMISIYKYNSSLLKKAGDYVNTGEPIAYIGAGGEDISAPHLHFELWYNGSPVNPKDYIPF